MSTTTHAPASNVTAVRAHVEGWLEADDTPQELLDPADVRQRVALLTPPGEDVAEAAIRVAYEARRDWARTPAQDRGAILERAASRLADRADEVARTMTREMGKILAESRLEVARSVDVLRFFAQQPRAIAGQTFPLPGQHESAFTVRVPLGVVGLITPWNFPLSIPTWKTAAALAYGNTVVLKAAELAPCSAQALVECLLDAGLPAGVLSFLPGRGAQLGPVLTRSRLVAGVSFTGSTPVGKGIVRSAADRGIPVQCELGGRNAVVVLADGDLDAAVDAIVLGGFGTSGQRCTSSSRVIVERSVAEELTERLVAAADGLTVGPGLDPDSAVGPLVSGDALEQVLADLERAEAEGTTVLTGGTRCTDPRLEHGHFMAPALTRGPADGWFAGHEVFGPVVSIFEAADFDEAVALNNAVEYGLASSVFTNDLAKAMRFVHETDTGMVHVNRPTVGAEAHVPFGGSKDSSHGPREMAGAFEFFTRTRSAHVRWG
jgi:alpha-ketoglutaric semialdehyde dehydrogenase